MKFLAACGLALVTMSSAFADYVCIKNNGVYLMQAYVSITDGMSGEIYTERFNPILLGQTECSRFNPANGSSVTVRISHSIFIGVDRETCSYNNIREGRLIQTHGTTLNYWCTDEKN